MSDRPRLLQEDAWTAYRAPHERMHQTLSAGSASPPTIKVAANSEVESHSLATWFGPPFRTGWPVVWPLFGMLIASGLFRLTNLDLFVASQFYDHDTQTWPWFYSTVCTMFYRKGVYPAFALFTLGCVLTVLGFTQRNFGSVRRAGCFLLVVFLIGPGLIVNVAFKNTWGRPRPHQLEQFGGDYAFAPVGQMGTLERHNSSFPSGHAAVAFYLMAPAFLVHERRIRLSRILLGAGLLFGTGMSITRVVQGGHFVSDVLWSAAIVYLTSVACAHVLLRPRTRVAQFVERPVWPLSRAA